MPTRGVLMAAMLAGTALVQFTPALAAAPHDAGQSVFPVAPDEPGAVTVKGAGDGKADDTAAIQQALDQARDRTGHGIVFLPSGTWRITRTLVVPAGVRLYGVGVKRPTILLGARTPGFQKGVSTMIVFGGEDQYAVGKVPVPVPTVVPRDKVVRDANSGTFYSAMSNVDIEVGTGNPAAAGVRFRMAQHAFLSHMDFRLGDAFAGVYQAGNVIENVHFHGGRYGIVTEKTSPAWQFTLIDSTFDGQKNAAIREHEVDLTLVNVSIRDTPVGIEVDRGYGDSLWGKDVRFENVSRSAVVISNENNVFTQIGFENALASGTPVFARFRDSGKTVTGKGAAYKVSAFSYGLAVPQLGKTGEYATQAEIEGLPALPPPRTPAIRDLPPMAEWVNARKLGIAGDGKADDTAAIQRAIDTNRVLYFPTGFYKVTDRLKLRPDSVLIGLHPAITQFYIPDDNPGHAGLGAMVPILESPRGGDNVLSGLGLFTGRVNPRAGALLWRSGENSLVEDVKIMGGGGTPTADGKPLGALAVERTRSGDPVSDGRWDAQYPSIWVTDNGGGTFANVWSPNTFSSAGLMVTNTSTPGHVYEMSVEHHARNEIVLDNVHNWEFLAPQTEQEVGDGPNAVSLEIRNSSNLLFANYHGYRVTRSYAPAKTAVKLFNSGDIRFRNVHVNGESGYAACDDEGCGTFLRASKYPFDNAIEDISNGLQVREREFARLDVGPAGGATLPPAQPAGPAVTKVADGFWSISGAATDPAGALYFIDRRFQRIHRWSEGKGLEIVRDHALDPVNLAVDASGRLLVLSSLGAKGGVYSIDPNNPTDEMTIIQPTPVRSGSKARSLLPVNWWNNGEFRDQLNHRTYEFTTLAEMFARDVGTPKPREYVSPDGSIALPAFRVWQQGPVDHVGWRWSDGLNANGLIGGKQGERIYVTNGSENVTYSGVIGSGGTLKNLKAVANRGGESVAVDRQGRLYVANGQVFVYGADGKEQSRIDVPERPLQILFGGADGGTLFILTHHALYTARP